MEGLRGALVVLATGVRRKTQALTMGDAEGGG